MDGLTVQVQITTRAWSGPVKGQVKTQGLESGIGEVDFRHESIRRVAVELGTQFGTEDAVR